jgi:AraC-like DNA-binding protein
MKPLCPREFMPDPKPTSSAQYTQSFFATCIEAGASAQRLGEILGAGETHFANPLERFECDRVLDMIAYAQEETGERSLGLKTGMRVSPSTFLDVGRAFTSANSLRHALSINAKYQRLTQEFGKTHLDVDRMSARITWTPYTEDAQWLRPVTEAAFVGYASIGRWLLWHYNEDALVMKFRHSMPCDPDPCAEFFGCEVRYDQPENCLEFKAALADLPLPQANPDLLRTLEARLSRALENLDNLHRLANRVHHCVLYSLGTVPVSLTSVARQLSMSEQSLARVLKQEGTSFREILQDVRKNNAEFYLRENRRSLSEIALALGYADQSAFTRAYRSWHGIPPSLSGERPGRSCRL